MPSRRLSILQIVAGLLIWIAGTACMQVQTAKRGVESPPSAAKPVPSRGGTALRQPASGEPNLNAERPEDEAEQAAIIVAGDSIGEQAGVPWTGAMGITETVAEIMAREAQTPGPTPGEVREPEVVETRPVDRTQLPQNPASPYVSQWPAANAGAGAGLPASTATDNESRDGGAMKLPERPQPSGQDSTSNGDHPPNGDVPDRNGGPYLPQVVGTNFQGANIGESGFIPPDSMGAIGPTQYLVCVNGRIKVFDRSGTLGGLNASTNTFFNSVRNASGTSDPQVRFDRLSNRWFVVMINVSPPNRILIAVSSGPTITSSASFTFFQFQQDAVGGGTSDNGGLADYPSLGIDNNALYIGCNMFNAAGTAFLGTTGFVVRKTSVTGGGPIVVTAFRQMGTGTSSGPYAPRGVDNDDSSATEGYFLGVDTNSFGTLYMRRILTPGGTPTISANISLAVPATANPIAVPAQGSTSPLSALDDRLFAAAIHKNQLTGVRTMWAAHNIQVTSGGVAGSGGRNGSRWYQLQNFTSTLSLVQSGTLFDSAASNPRSYWIPSCAMSGQGHMALGCSVAGAAERAECAAAGRLSGDSLGSIQAATVFQTSSTNYNVQTGVSSQRWGDYSFTSVDPNDDMTMWTIQEYCDASNSWAVRVAQLSAPPPATPASCSPSTVSTGTTANVIVTGTSSSGSGFFDPDASYPNHISASVSGTGVTVNSVTLVDTTHVSLNITVAGGASTGARNVTITNPDGQSATGNGILTIGVGCGTITVSPTTLPNGAVGTSYSQNVTASGGTAPYSFGVTVGSLPNGLTLTSNGALTGNPTTAGLFNFTITATDSSASSCTGNRTYSVRICPVVTVNPATLPNGVVGTAYSQTVSGSGGTSPYTFAVTSGSLPPPLTLNTSSGLISGTPNTSGTFNFTVTASDANGCAGSRAYGVQICPAISISPTSLPNGTVGVLYSQTITASGGAAPYTYSTTGNVPAGLSINPTSGVFSGTPSAAGLFSFTILATDINGCVGSRIYTGVRICPVVSMSPATLPGGTIGAPYNQTLTGSGGTSPYTFALTAGSLPTNLILSSSGVLSGTPTTENNYSFTLTATDANGCAGTANYSVRVCPASITVNPSSLPGGTIGTAYSQTLTGSGGIGPYTFAVTGGSLPNNLTLSSAGVLSGTPTTENNFSFTVTTTDSIGCTGSASYSIRICPASITVNPSTLPGGTIGTTYTQFMSATGGSSPYTFAVTSGSLPSGLTMGSNGAISGIPNTENNFSFSITATDAIGCTGTRGYNVRVCPASITIAPTNLPGGTIGAAYNQTLSSSGGVGPYSYAVTSGALPGGLSLSGAGVLSGTPTTENNFSFTVTTTDSVGCTGTRSYNVRICPAAITISPATIPGATVGTSYSQTLTATGGAPAYAFTLTGGALPDGLMLATTGELSGTPTTEDNYSFSVLATDAFGCTGLRAYDVRVCPASMMISPASLPDGAVGTAYSQTLTGSGGTAPYSFAVTSGSLPGGLSLATNGHLTGTPTAELNSTFTVTMTDSIGCTATANYTIRVCPAAITLSPATLPGGSVGSAYSVALSASGGMSPYTFAVTSGVLPDGLSLATDGTLSGDPTLSGSYAFTVTATDALGCAGSANYGIVICSASITLSPASLPGATAGTSYDETITAAGGTEPYSFAVTTGSLPDGIALALDGTLTGTPTTSGVASFTVTATDALGCTGAAGYSMTVCPASIALSPSTLPGGAVGTAYSETVTASGGNAPYAFSVSAGTLPDGLTLATTGELSGTPTLAGSFSFSVTATDSIGCTGSAGYTVSICSTAITISPATLPDGTIGLAYHQTLSASGGSAPYAFGVTAGALPDGLTLASDGTLSGNPTTEGNFTFTVTATDALGCSAGANYAIRICPAAITLTPATLPDGMVGAAYSQALSGNGGTAPYGFAVTSGALPDGLALSNAGTVSGTPTLAGTFNFVVTATDAFGCSGSLGFSIRVCATITLSPATLPAGTIGTPYSQVISASGGSSPYLFAVTLGMLPGGLSLSSAGALSGTPTSAGTSNFTVTATDATGCTGDEAYSLSIGASCPLLGDLNGDGLIDGLDVQVFAECLINGSSAGGTCACGDMDGSGAVASPDVALFVASLL